MGVEDVRQGETGKADDIDSWKGKKMVVTT